jgi:hypothetical protein
MIWDDHSFGYEDMGYNGLHGGVISQKIVLFVTTGVRASNPTYSSSMGRLLVDTFHNSRSYGSRKLTFTDAMALYSRR